MSMKTTDKLLSGTRGDPTSAINIAQSKGAERLSDVGKLVRTYYDLGPKIGVDASEAVAAAFEETGCFKNRWWKERLNAGSLGVTGDPAENEASPTFSSPEAAAKAHIAHLLLYATGKIDRGGLTPADDPRYDDYRQTFGDRAVATTLAELSGKYAGDLSYANNIAGWGNLLWPGLPNQQSKSLIPSTHSVDRPTIYTLADDYARFGLSRDEAQSLLAHKFAGRNGKRPMVIVYHIQDGYTRGSLSYWLGVQASSTVMIQQDGSILRVIPEEDGPWTNGDVNQPTAEANELLALGGNPNIWSLTIEAEGVGAVRNLTPVQKQAVIWQTQDWIIHFPELLDLYWSLLRHGFINTVDKINCGLYLDEIVAPINDWLDSAGAAPVTPPPAPKPALLFPEGMTFELARELYGSVRKSWTSKTLGFDLNRSECQYWLAHAKSKLRPGESYEDTEWPPLENVIRRGKSKNIHLYQWGDGDTYEKLVRADK